MFKATLLMVTVFNLAFISGGFCGIDDDSDDDTSQSPVTKVNPWVAPVRPLKDEVQIEKEFRGDVPCWAEQDLMGNTKRFGRNQAAIMASDPGELHLKEWRNGPKKGSFENYAFNWAVWRAQVAVLKQAEGLLAQEIDIFRKYEHLWGQAGQDVMAVFEAYYQWAYFRGKGEKSKPFADRNLPFYGSSLTRTPGQYPTERDMALFMEYVENYIITQKGHQDQIVVSIYYDKPSCDAKMSVTERFIRSKFHIADRFESQGRPLSTSYTLDDYATFARYGFFFDAEMWTRFADYFINSTAPLDIASAERLVQSVFWVVPNISDPNITYRMALCHLKFAEHLTGPALKPQRMLILRRATLWVSRLWEYIASKTVLLCDEEESGAFSLADNEFRTLAGTYSSRDRDVGHEGAERYEIFPRGQDLFLRMAEIILEEQDEVLDKFLPSLQAFIERYHIREAANERAQDEAFREAQKAREIEAQRRDAERQALVHSDPGTVGSVSASSSSGGSSVTTPSSLSLSASSTAGQTPEDKVTISQVGASSETSSVPFKANSGTSDDRFDPSETASVSSETPSSMAIPQMGSLRDYNQSPDYSKFGIDTNATPPPFAVTPPTAPAKLVSSPTSSPNTGATRVAKPSGQKSARGKKQQGPQDGCVIQ